MYVVGIGHPWVWMLGQPDNVHLSLWRSWLWLVARHPRPSAAWSAMTSRRIAGTRLLSFPPGDAEQVSRMVSQCASCPPAPTPTLQVSAGCWNSAPCFWKHCAFHTPFLSRSPPAHFLAVLSGVSSYCLGTSGYCKYLLNTNKISNANLRGNPMSSIVTSKYHKLEITFSVKLSVFICLPHSHTVTYQNVSHQLFEMTLMPWFPMPQVWCSWLAMCMLWAGSMAHCVCGQWTCMMGWRTSGRPSPACRSAGARWVQLCSMTCSMPWGALMAVLVGPGLSHHPAWDMHSMLLWFEASQVAWQ